MFDFEVDGQEYRFVREHRSAIGTKLWRFTTECAICRERIEVDTPAGQAATVRRCKAHRAKGAAVGSKAEARKIRAKGWTVVEGSVVDRLRNAGLARASGRPHIDPWLLVKAAGEPTPRKTKSPVQSKRKMAAARAEKVARRRARSAEFSLWD